MKTLALAISLLPWMLAGCTVTPFKATWYLVDERAQSTDQVCAAVQEACESEHTDCGSVGKTCTGSNANCLSVAAACRSPPMNKTKQSSCERVETVCRDAAGPRVTRVLVAILNQSNESQSIERVDFNPTEDPLGRASTWAPSKTTRLESGQLLIIQQKDIEPDWGPCRVPVKLEVFGSNPSKPETLAISSMPSALPEDWVTKNCVPN